jgi:hypothetical protein
MAANRKRLARKKELEASSHVGSALHITRVDGGATGTCSIRSTVLNPISEFVGALLKEQVAPGLGRHKDGDDAWQKREYEGILSFRP